MAANPDLQLAIHWAIGNLVPTDSMALPLRTISKSTEPCFQVMTALICTVHLLDRAVPIEWTCIEIILLYITFQTNLFLKKFCIGMS